MKFALDANSLIMVDQAAQHDGGALRRMIVNVSHLKKGRKIDTRGHDHRGSPKRPRG
jgi:hypothetical protein